MATRLVIISKRLFNESCIAGVLFGIKLSGFYFFNVEKYTIHDDYTRLQYMPIINYIHSDLLFYLSRPCRTEEVVQLWYLAYLVSGKLAGSGQAQFPVPVSVPVPGSCLILHPPVPPLPPLSCSPAAAAFTAAQASFVYTYQASINS